MHNKYNTGIGNYAKCWYITVPYGTITNVKESKQ